MDVGLLQKYDANVSQLQREDGDGHSSQSLTEPNSESEAAEVRQLGMIWKGRLLLGFQSPPSALQMGWTVPAAKSEVSRSVPLHSCLRQKARDQPSELPRFNFNLKNRALFIAGGSRSQHAELTER